MEKKKFIVVMVSLTLAVLLAAPQAMAERGFGIGPRIGYAKASDADDGTLYLGGDINFRFFDSLLGVRGEVGWRGDTIDLPLVDGKLDIHTIPLLASVTVHPLKDKLLSPYAIAGAGWYYLIYDGEVTLPILGKLEYDDSDSTFGWHIGGGLEVNIGEHFSVNADIRYVWFELEFEDIDDVDASGLQATGGFTFYF